MRRVLHILVREQDDWGGEIIADQQGAPDLRVDVVDCRRAEPDNRALLEKIFAADSVAVW